MELELGNQLNNKELPLAARFRALFTLKSLNNQASIVQINNAFDTNQDQLLNHELAYVLGQMKNPIAIPFLSIILNSNHHPMTRHEAAEALGAIASPDSLPILHSHLDPSIEKDQSVRETCELAIAKITFENEQKAMVGGNAKETGYTSIDPAPPIEDSKYSVKELGRLLMDTEKSLFQRYRAMFTLRNIGTTEAVLQLANGFQDTSALFRHEIGYVFGQMRHEASIPSLIETLKNKEESAMVRHECAEALGSIGTPECLPILKEFASDEALVVKDSCIVGLDMWEYENSNEFQYADGLIK